MTSVRWMRSVHRPGFSRRVSSRYAPPLRAIGAKLDAQTVGVLVDWGI